MPTHPALERLHTYGRRYPGVWDFIARVQYWRERQKKNPNIVEEAERTEKDPYILAGIHAKALNWPDWCYAPAAAYTRSVRANYGLVTEEDEIAYAQTHGWEETTRMRTEVYALTAIAAWRPTQGIYRFDAGLFDALFDTQLRGHVPTDLLTRLPEWCPFVEFPEDSDQPWVKYGFYGFWAHLEPPTAAGSSMAITFVFETDEKNYSIVFPYNLSDTFENSFELTNSRLLDSVRRDLGNVPEAFQELGHMKDQMDFWYVMMQGCLSVLLYLCADEAEIPSIKKPEARSITTKKGRIITPTPTRYQVYECGARIGPKLKLAKERYLQMARDNPTGRTVLPHVRAAHWHTFMAGPRKGERERRVKWLPPIAVNMDLAEPPTPVIREVE